MLHIISDLIRNFVKKYAIWTVEKDPTYVKADNLLNVIQKNPSKFRPAFEDFKRMVSVQGPFKTRIRSMGVDPSSKEKLPIYKKIEEHYDNAIKAGEEALTNPEKINSVSNYLFMGNKIFKDSESILKKYY